MTDGNRTRFGRGNSRAVPQKSFSDSWSSVMDIPLSLLVFGEELRRVGPVVRGRVEPQDRQQRRVGAQGSVRLGDAQQSGEAAFHLSPEIDHVKAQERRAARLHVFPAGVIELDRPAQVAVAEVAQPDGGLDQALVELPLRSERLRPEVLPDLVRLEERLFVEEHDAGQVARVVLHAFRPSLRVARRSDRPDWRCVTLLLGARRSRLPASLPTRAGLTLPRAPGTPLHPRHFRLTRTDRLTRTGRFFRSDRPFPSPRPLVCVCNRQGAAVSWSRLVECTLPDSAPVRALTRKFFP